MLLKGYLVFAFSDNNFKLNPVFKYFLFFSLQFALNSDYFL